MTIASPEISTADRARNFRRAVLALLVVNVLWGMSFPLMKMANAVTEGHFAATSSGAAWTGFSVASASFLLATRFSLALALLFLLLPRRVSRCKPSHWMMGALVGLPFTSGMILQIMGLSYIPASRSGFLTSLAIVMLPVFSFLLGKGLPSRRVVFSVLCALIGAAVLTGVFVIGERGLQIAPEAKSCWNFGDTLTICATVLFAIQILLLDHFGKRNPDAELTPGMFLATAAIGMLGFAILSRFAPYSSPSDWLDLLKSGPFLMLIAPLSIFCSAFAFYLMNRFQPFLSPTQAGILYTIEPICATSWGLFLPGLLAPRVGVDYANETITAALLAGGGLVLIANLLALGERRA